MRYTYASVDPQQVNSMLDDFTLDTAPDQNSPEQFGYSPPLRRDSIHESRHRATLARRQHHVLQQPAQERLFLRHHVACPLHDTRTMPIKLILVENLSLIYMPDLIKSATNWESLANTKGQQTNRAA
jgi:hypothetical protein